jgi:hypothetical protein
MSPCRIRDLNDAFRRPFICGRVVGTAAGFIELPDRHRADIVRRVRAFDAFTPDNGPHGEHDFGAIEYPGIRYFWKIDYYDRQLVQASPDPADPALTVRVMTVMRADEC